MKIDPPKSSNKISQIFAELQAITEMPTATATKPCDGCNKPCSCSTSPLCTCDCHMHCEHSLKQMSSEPDRYPIEPAIGPLVYAMNTIEGLQPCWSCEGHLNGHDAISHLPALWFYCDSQSLLRMIASHIGLQKAKKNLLFNWIIEVSPYSNNNTTTYILKPDQNDAEYFSLKLLHRDIDHLASTLYEAIKNESHGELTLLNNSR